MLSRQIGSTNTCGAISTRPCTGRPEAAAWTSAIEAPSEWPINSGRAMPSRSSRTGSTSSASSCMKRGVLGAMRPSDWP